MRSLLLATALLVAASADGASALASEPSAADKETGRALFAQGMAALDAHDYAGAERACRGARAIVKVPTASTCLGRALEGLGLLVEARDAFIEAAHYPAAAGEPNVFTEARSAASAEADALAERIPSLLLVVAGPPETAKLRATVDGVAMPSDTVRLPRRVDPGKHVVEVGAPGFRHARIEVAAVERQEQRVAVSLDPSVPEGRSSAPVEVEPTGPASAGSSGIWRTTALVIGGAGVASAVVGAVFGAVAGAKWSSAKADCGTGCGPTAPAQGEKSAAASDATASTIGLAVGGVLIAGGLALYLTAPSRTRSAVGIRLAPDIGANRGGLVLRGGF
jgi:hypothetical protein